MANDWIPHDPDDTPLDTVAKSWRNGALSRIELPTALVIAAGEERPDALADSVARLPDELREKLAEQWAVTGVGFMLGANLTEEGSALAEEKYRAGHRAIGALVARTVFQMLRPMLVVHRDPA